MVNQVKRKLLASAISLSLAVQAPSALSLGLGAAQVKSQIGEPLLAEIPILDGKSQYDLNEILVRQVRGRLAEQLGFDLAADSVGYFLKVVERDGRLFLLVRSKRIMAEPFVSVLVELEWPNGKLYRDYNLLLDLAPIRVEAPVSSTSRSSVPPVNNSSLKQSSTSASSSAKPVTSNTASNYQHLTPTRSSVSRAASEHWRVGGGDTLSQIAQKIRPDDQIKLTAVVEAIFRLNPAAFANGNINRMQGGSLLVLPSPQDFASMPRWDGKQGVAQAARGMVSAKESGNTTNSNDLIPAGISNGNGTEEVSSGQYQQAGSSKNRLPRDREPSEQREVSTLPAIKPLDSYRVQSGDTLSQVAQRLRRDPAVKLEDMMQLLFAHNPNAFANGDINQLQLGASLQVPPHGQARAATRVAPDAKDYSQSAADEPGAASSEKGDATVGPSEVISLQSDELSQSAQDAEARLTLSAQSNLNQSSLTEENSAKEILSQIDAVAELVDKVNRENQSIRQRIERIEQSEQLALLERLLELQTRQIENLREAMLAEQLTDSSIDDDQKNLDGGVAASDLKPSEVVTVGDELSVDSTELALLEAHLSQQNEVPDLSEEQSVVEAVENSGSQLTGKDSDSLPVSTEGSRALQAEESQRSFWSMASLSLLIGIVGFVAFLFVARRRQLFDWLNQKLNLFEQNKDDASLPRVWDPELGAWRVKEEIRKPMLTPLATSLKDIEEGLAAHEANERAAEMAAGQDQSDHYDVNAQAGLDEDAAGAPDHTGIEFVNDDIDDMFEELPDVQSDSSNSLQDQTKEAEDDFPLLDELHLSEEKSEDDKSEMVFDNLDGEFEFSLPDDLFEAPSAPILKTQSNEPLSHDAQVKASILEKTKNYEPDSIDGVLDDWLHNGIPAAEISEYEDVISEAMIYAAYGRHDHAEQLLLEQLKENPEEEKLHAALLEVQKSNAQFKSGQGFGVVEGDAPSFDLPSAPEGLGELKLDLEEGFSEGQESESSKDFHAPKND